MQQGTLEELIAFCEQKKLTEIVTGLKQELKTMKKPASGNAKTAQTQSKDSLGTGTSDPAEMQKRTLKIIKDALIREDKKNIKQRKPAEGKPVPEPKKKPLPSLAFNKEENEEIMEGLMNKIVVNPAFINDDKLNAKIEKIFGVKAFQKMVDNTEVFQDISNTSIFN